jgi:hypothetical protein
MESNRFCFQISLRPVSELRINKQSSNQADNLCFQPRSNMHGRKRPFTEKNGDIRRSYTVSVHRHRIRSETVKPDSVYGDRIKIRSDSKVKLSTPYTELYDCRIRSYIIVYSRIWSYTVTICVTFRIRTESE